MATKPKFTTVSSNEVRLDYKGNKFMLVEQNRGVYGIGRAIQLYLMEGFEKKHIKEIGWTKGDNHGGEFKDDSFLKGIVTGEDCKKAAIKYIDIIL
jgi:hypothetical protein